MNWNLLYRYVNGQCSEEELQQLGEWLKEDPANEDFFSSFIEEWYDQEDINFDSDARSAWINFRKQHLGNANNRATASGRSVSASAGDKDKAYSKSSPKNNKGIAFWSYSLAAVLLLVATLYFAVQNFSDSSQSHSRELTYQEIQTVQGQRTNLKLSDGTLVSVNASSTLRIPKNYGPENRTVYLEGEAFFEVAHNEDNPFTVITYQTVTRDLGTQFNISAYDSSSVEVAVKEGKVSLGTLEGENPNKEITELNPNELGKINREGQTTVSRIEKIEQYVGWTEGKLVFRQTAFPKVMERLERWYDIDIRVQNSGTGGAMLAERTLTATYDNMPLTEVLKVLSVSMDITYERDGRTVTFQNQETEIRNSNPATTN